MSRILPLVLFVFIILAYQNLQAQLGAKENLTIKQIQATSKIPDTPRKLRSLSIGEIVPDITFNMLNYSSPVVKLSDFKGKLVLIDFWATWCYSCMASYPKLDNLQKKFNGKVQVILINSVQTGDKVDAIKKYILRSKFPNNTPFPLATAIEDSVAVKLFPHFSLPHTIWISPSGVLKAITGGKELKEEFVSRILEDESIDIDLPIKKDYFPDQLMDFALENQVPIDNTILHYSLLKKGKIDGLNSLDDEQFELAPDGKGHIFRGIAIRNLPLIEIFEKVIFYNWKFKGYSRKRLILNVNDSSKLFFDPKKNGNIEDWERQNLYSYNLILPESERPVLFKRMLHDLNLNSPFEAQIEKRKVKCLSLINSKNMPVSKTHNVSSHSQELKSSKAGGKLYLENVTGEYIAGVLDKNPGIKLPVINNSNSIVIDNIVLDIKNLELESLRKQLEPLGLQLIEVEHELEMFIISQKP